MPLIQARDCPLCGGRPVGQSFPYASLFNSKYFKYLKCNNCRSVFIDPLPDDSTFLNMYAKLVYHNIHLEHVVKSEHFGYIESVKLLKQYIEPGVTVLDYGCGTGIFLRELASNGFVPVGVEFDQDAAISAADFSSCEVFSVVTFNSFSSAPRFEAIHLGDVLEHLPNPAAILAHLITFLKPGGVLFIEGPLESNPSPVFWVAKSYGVLKKLCLPSFLSDDSPTHLFRTNADAQKAFFARVVPSLKMHHWQVYETGWPYASGSFIKRSIAAFAKLIGGKYFVGITFGNRFKAVLVRT